MKFFAGSNKSKSKRRVVVIGIDGTPYSFIKKHVEAGDFPHLKRILEGGELGRMKSVQPCISSVAWSTYMTGVNPARHRIFGFIDRNPNPFELFIPMASHMGAKTLWEILSAAGKRVAVINVPVTYPPRPVNGILIGCFLATDVLKCAYPKELGLELRDWGYRIDADANLGRKDKNAFFEDLHLTLDKRWEAARRLFEREEWDFFQLHVMETDRINHFLWEHYDKQDPAYYGRFLDFYRRVDELVGEFYNRAEKTAEFILLSDHGFCSVKKEVYLNQWLEERGYLHLEGEAPKSVMDMGAKTRAYSLIPGRIFINLQGREQKGSVLTSEAESLKNELRKSLLEMKDPATSQPIVEKVLRREEIYSGAYFEEAADLIAVPYDGYDLKANVRQPQFTFKGDLVGMHTYPDAALFVKDRQLPDREFGIIDVAPSILKMMEVEDPVGMDGRSLI